MGIINDNGRRYLKTNGEQVLILGKDGLEKVALTLSNPEKGALSSTENCLKIALILGKDGLRRRNPMLSKKKVYRVIFSSWAFFFFKYCFFLLPLF